MKMHIKNPWQLGLTQFFADMLLKPAMILVFLLMVFGYSGVATAELVIGADDALQIKVYGYDDLATETRVSSDGRISFPLIGEVSVGGQSTFEVESKIAKLLTNGGFIQNPHVTVTVLEFKSQQVSVLGFVNKPGLYPLESRSSLVDMLAMAGGISQLGDHRAIVTRHSNGKTIKQEIDLRVALEHPEDSNQFAAVKGDVIYIPKAPVFYIQGEVMHPGAFNLEPKMTVSQALSLGGGLTPKGTLRGIVIERHDANGKSEEIAVKMTDAVLKDDVLIFQERLF